MIGYSSDGYVKVLDIEYGINDRVKYQWLNDEPVTVDIDYSEDEPCFMVGEVKYYFNEIMRSNL